MEAPTTFGGDISAHLIAAPSVSGELINRARKGMNPYSPIQKVPSKTQSGNITGYGVEIEYLNPKTDLPEWDLAGTVGPDYLLIPNADVRDIADEVIAKSGLEGLEDRTFFDGKRYFRSLVLPEITQAVSVGDEVSAGIMFQNSYDGSTAFSAGLFAERLVCRNGMVSKQYFSRVRFRHTSDSEGWAEELERALSLLTAAPTQLKQLIEGLRKLAGTPMTDAHLRQFRTGPLSHLPSSKWGAVVDRYVEEEEATAYGLLNATTNVLWHRGSFGSADLSQNDAAVTGLLDYAFKSMN